MVIWRLHGLRVLALPWAFLSACIAFLDGWSAKMIAARLFVVKFEKRLLEPGQVDGASGQVVLLRQRLTSSRAEQIEQALDVGAGGAPFDRLVDAIRSVPLGFRSWSQLAAEQSTVFSIDLCGLFHNNRYSIRRIGGY
jgi:hypothetical protein